MSETERALLQDRLSDLQFDYGAILAIVAVLVLLAIFLPGKLQKRPSRLSEKDKARLKYHPEKRKAPSFWTRFPIGKLLVRCLLIGMILFFLIFGPADIHRQEEELRLDLQNGTTETYTGKFVYRWYRGDRWVLPENGSEIYLPSSFTQRKHGMVYPPELVNGETYVGTVVYAPNSRTVLEITLQ